MSPIRAQVEQRIAELTQWSARIDAHLRAPVDADSQEAASALSGEEVVEALDTSTRHELDTLRATLARIDAGTWGICERCGEPIGDARLHAMPTAATCRACAD